LIKKNITETGFFNTFNDHHDHDHGKVKTSKFSQDPGDHSGKKKEKVRLLMVLGASIHILKVKILLLVI